MVTELVSGLLIGFGIGYGLDVFFETLPIFTVVFIFLGFAAGVRVMLSTARELQMQHTPGPTGEDKGD
jgi:ATP synthase protein I